ncbi:MAG: nucleotidyl transferase AbiEii/AbiGii toxin family protein [Acidobacteria bacterium]|nr:nucleotidyl transferase AbiEii/AbiGii toxin family protein [Acidobacteriota bacterium]
MTLRFRESTYRPQSEDTSVEVDRMMFALSRQLTRAERCARVASAARVGEALEMAGRRLRHPDGSDADLWRELVLDRVRRLAPAGGFSCQDLRIMTQPPLPSDPIEVALQVIAVLRELDIRYAVGGSVASAIHGEPRFTEDVDIAADIAEHQIQALVTRLSQTFLVPEEQVRRAVHDGTSFSVIHLSAVRKVDIFVVGRQPLRRGQLERRESVDLGRAQFYVVSPEDIVLQKLIWYREGCEVSDRQWRDVLGVLKLQGDRLDLAYLRDGARAGKTAVLLERALSEAGLGPSE